MVSNHDVAGDEGFPGTEMLKNRFYAFYFCRFNRN